MVAVVGKKTEARNTAQTGVLICLPAYNEEKYIGSLVLRSRAYGDEVLVVDDGSRDKTAEVARLAGATVVQHEHNKGYGESIKTILKEAKIRKSRVLVVLDADYQHTPDEIPRLVNSVGDGNDLVIGSRKVQKNKIPRYRRLGQKVLSIFARILSGTNVDSESGFRAFSARAVNALELKNSGFAIDTEMLAAAVDSNLRIVEVPISVTYTKDGSTLNPIVHGFGNLFSIVNMISVRKPLTFFLASGLLLLVFGFVIEALGISAMGNARGTIGAGTMVSFLLVAAGVASIFTGIALNLTTRHRQRRS